MIHELSHPLAKTLVNRLRSMQTDALAFRHCIGELARMLLYEALRNHPTRIRSVSTWRGPIDFESIEETELMLVPILRAGLPMLEGVMPLFPEATVGFLAMKRNETTHKAELFYDRVPDCRGKYVMILDPMLATGGSLCDAVDVIKSKGAAGIIALNIIGAPEGLDHVERRHGDIELYIAQIDDQLDAQMFIEPGLGDAGDRAYNTPEA